VAQIEWTSKRETNHANAHAAWKQRKKIELNVNVHRKRKEAINQSTITSPEQWQT